MPLRFLAIVMLTVALDGCGQSVDEAPPVPSTGGSTTTAGTGGTTSEPSGGGGFTIISSVPEPPEGDRDGDGLQDPEEELYGTNPDSPDTDGDGCEDLPQVVLGGCDQPEDAYVYGCDGEASIVLTVDPALQDEPDDLTLVVRPDAGALEEDLWPTPVALSPSDGGIIEEEKLISVAAGTQVTLSVIPRVVFRWSGYRSYTIDIASAARGVLASGRVLWRRPPSSECPYVG